MRGSGDSPEAWARRSDQAPAQATTRRASMSPCEVRRTDVGGPLALVESGDIVSLDVPGRRLDLEVAEEELARRRSLWVPRDFPAGRGYERLFAEHVTQADAGCDFDFLHGAAGVPEPAIY